MFSFIKRYNERKAAEEARKLEELRLKSAATLKLVIATHRKLGFKCSKYTSGPTSRDYIGCTVVGPDNKVYRLTAYSTGGYDLNLVK